MRKKPNRAEIEAEIRALDDCKKYIPHFNKFGENNFEAIDAGVSALADRLTVDMAYECAGDEPSPEGQGKIDAALWMAGESTDGSPSSGWDQYKPKAKKP
jgi:hypothetical protein